MASTDAGGSRKIRLDLGPMAEGISPGDSVSVGGCCLTVEALEGAVAEVTAVPETLARTTLGALRPGGAVNIERSLRVGDEVGGHFVYGHIDGVGEVVAVADDPAAVRIRIPGDLAIYLVPKGSITVEGVSLTIAAVDGDVFTVVLVPFTLERTTLGRLKPGDGVNVETDYLARIVHRLLAESGPIAPDASRSAGS